jgi:hypothetical protein
MRVRKVLAAIVLGGAMLAGAMLGGAGQARAQGMPEGMGGMPPIDFNDPDVQEMMQAGMQMVQRMQEAGIDLQAVADQVQAGTFDPEAFQQQLIDKGVIDAPMMERMQKTGQRMASKILKTLLNSTDEEWAILGPRVEKVITLATVAQRGGVQVGMGSVRNISAVQKAMDALKAEMKDPGTTESKIAIKLKEWREAYAKAKAELQAAREELRAVLTVRQEGILMNFGLLD